MFAAVALFAGFATYLHSASDDVQRPGRNALDDLLEVVLLSYLDSGITCCGERQKTYYLTISGKDPENTFLSRFRNDHHSVVKGSEYSGNVDATHFEILKVRWVDQDSAWVTTRYSSTHCSIGSTRGIHRDNGEWKVGGETANGLTGCGPEPTK